MGFKRFANIGDWQWSWPIGVNRVRIRLWGGGGSGGGSNSGVPGGAGASAAYVEAEFDRPTSGLSRIVVGPGGAPIPAGQSLDGNNGGLTAFYLDSTQAVLNCGSYGAGGGQPANGGTGGDGGAGGVPIGPDVQHYILGRMGQASAATTTQMPIGAAAPSGGGGGNNNQDGMLAGGGGAPGLGTNPSGKGGDGLLIINWDGAPFVDNTPLVPFSPPPTPGSVKMLLHCDGPIDSTTFADSSGLFHHANGNGAMCCNTNAQARFGGYSMVLDGMSGFASVLASADFYPGDGDFTWDMWVNPSSDRLAAILGPPGLSNMGIWQNHGRFAYYASTTGSTWNVANTVDMGPVTIGAWQHLAAVRAGNVIKLFNNGAQVGAEIPVSGALFASAQPIEFGRWSGGFFFSGYLDEIRWSKGIAQWAANFAPPEIPYA